MRKGGQNSAWWVLSRVTRMDVLGMIILSSAESRRPAMNHRPIAIGMVLCEQLIVEEGTHNVTPVNCFNVREVEDVPDRATFFALAWLVNGMGEMPMEVLVERLDNF